MKVRLLVPVFVFLVVLVAACPSKEDQLTSARRDRRDLLEELYKAYGGGALAAELQKDAAKEKATVEAKPEHDGKNAAVELLRMAGNAVGEVDRAAFEGHCETLGGGGRPMILSEKAKTYFAQASVESSCGKVVQLGQKIRALESELGVKPPGP